jgi:hypothetical protein
MKCIRNIGDIKFTSCTYRLFKNKPIEDATIVDNVFGALVTYETAITHYENEFSLDQSITFKVQF